MNSFNKKKSIISNSNVNLGDLEHMRAVKQEKHNKFVKDKDMQSFMISAKTGESVIIYLYIFISLMVLTFF